MVVTMGMCWDVFGWIITYFMIKICCIYGLLIFILYIYYTNISWWYTNIINGILFCLFNIPIQILFLHDSDTHGSNCNGITGVTVKLIKIRQKLSGPASHVHKQSDVPSQAQARAPDRPQIPKFDFCLAQAASIAIAVGSVGAAIIASTFVVLIHVETIDRTVKKFSDYVCLVFLCVFFCFKMFFFFCLLFVGLFLLLFFFTTFLHVCVQHRILYLLVCIILIEFDGYARYLGVIISGIEWISMIAIELKEILSVQSFQTNFLSHEILLLFFHLLLSHGILFTLVVIAKYGLLVSNIIIVTLNAYNLSVFISNGSDFGEETCGEHGVAAALYYVTTGCGQCGAAEATFMFITMGFGAVLSIFWIILMNMVQMAVILIELCCY